MSGFLNKAVAGQISSWKQIFLPTVSISWRGLSYVLLISPATFRVERNSSFLRVPRRVFFPSLLMFCHTNASTVRQLPVAPSCLPVCTALVLQTPCLFAFTACAGESSPFWGCSVLPEEEQFSSPSRSLCLSHSRQNCNTQTLCFSDILFIKSTSTVVK